MEKHFKPRGQQVPRPWGIKPTCPFEEHPRFQCNWHRLIQEECGTRRDQEDSIGPGHPGLSRLLKEFSFFNEWSKKPGVALSIGIKWTDLHFTGIIIVAGWPGGRNGTIRKANWGYSSDPAERGWGLRHAHGQWRRWGRWSHRRYWRRPMWLAYTLNVLYLEISNATSKIVSWVTRHLTVPFTEMGGKSEIWFWTR